MVTFYLLKSALARPWQTATMRVFWNTRIAQYLTCFDKEEVLFHRMSSLLLADEFRRGQSGESRQ